MCWQGLFSQSCKLQFCTLFTICTDRLAKPPGSIFANSCRVVRGKRPSIKELSHTKFRTCQEVHQGAHIGELEVFVSAKWMMHNRWYYLRKMGASVRKHGWKLIWKKLEKPGFDPTKTRSKISIFSIYKRDPILGQKGRIWTQLSKLDNMNKIGPYGQKFDNMDTIGQCGQKGTKNWTVRTKNWTIRTKLDKMDKNWTKNEP